MRDLSRSLLHKEGDEKDYAASTDFAASSSSSKPNQLSTLAESKSSSYINNNNYQDAKDAKAAMKKPAWALSSTAAEALSEAKQQSEEDELLNFVDNLDFDQTIQDIEVKVMTEKLRKRIEELEKEVVIEDQREADAEVRASKRAMLELMVSTQIYCIPNSFLIISSFITKRVKQNNLFVI